MTVDSRVGLKVDSKAGNWADERAVLTVVEKDHHWVGQMADSRVGSMVGLRVERTVGWMADQKAVVSVEMLARKLAVM